MRALHTLQAARHLVKGSAANVKGSAANVKADTAQDEKRANAPLSTKERNRTGNRILQTIVLIAGAGRSAFTDEPSPAP